MLQLAVIVFCILGGAGLIVREQLKQPVSLEGKAPAFGLVVEQARQPDSAISPDLVDQLQLAEAALVRGQRQLARLRYQQLYDQLSSTKQSSTSSFNAETAQIPASSLASPHQQIVQLIRHRLASIGP